MENKEIVGEQRRLRIHHYVGTQKGEESRGNNILSDVITRFRKINSNPVAIGFIDSAFAKVEKTIKVLQDKDVLDGITVVVDKETGFTGIAVCKRPDKFSRKAGRILATGKMVEELLFYYPGLRRKKIVLHNDSLYIFDGKEEVPVSAFITTGSISEDIFKLNDIRYEVKELVKEMEEYTKKLVAKQWLQKFPPLGGKVRVGIPNPQMFQSCCSSAGGKLGV